MKVSKDKDALPVRVVCNGYEDYEAIVSRSKVQKGWTITLTPAGKGNVTLPIRLDPNRGKVTNGTVAVYELTDVKRNEDGSIQGINDSGTSSAAKNLSKMSAFIEIPLRSAVWKQIKFTAWKSRRRDTIRESCYMTAGKCMRIRRC